MSDTTDEPMIRIRPISWSAILAGALIALVAQFLLNLLGLGIGLSAMPAPNIAGEDAAAAATMALAWWSVSGVIAALLGGIIAGVLSKRAGFESAMTHGLLAWTIATLAIMAAIAAGSGAAGAAAGPLGAQMADYQTLRSEAGRPASAGALGVAAGPAGDSAVRVDPAAAQRAEEAADAIGTAALSSLVALLVGALASAMGARWGNARTRSVAASTRIMDLEMPRIYGAGPLASDGPNAQTSQDGRRPYQERH